MKIKQTIVLALLLCMPLQSRALFGGDYTYLVTKWGLRAAFTVGTVTGSALTYLSGQSAINFFRKKEYGKAFCAGIFVGLGATIAGSSLKLLWDSRNL